MPRLRRPFGQFTAAGWVGLGVALFGLAVLAGFWAHIRFLAQLQTGRDASMSVADGISLVLAGCLLGWQEREALAWRRPAQGAIRGLAAGLMGLNALVLAENIVDRNLGVDWPGLHYWLADPALRVGRMAPNASLGFLLFGAAVVALPYTQTRRGAHLIRWLTGLMLAAGLSGIFGYAIHVEALYTFHGIPAMAPYTGAALVTLAGGFWLSWRERRWNRSAVRLIRSGRILTTAALVLVVAILAAGASGLAILWHVEAGDAASYLSLRRQERTAYVGTVIGAALERGRLDAGREAALWQQLTPAAPRAVALPSRDFTAVSLDGARGQPLAHAGQPVVHPAMDLPVAAGAELLWNRGFYLRQQLPVLAGARRLGTIELEQPLPLLAAIGVDTPAWGRSGEIGICGLSASIDWRGAPRGFATRPAYARQGWGPRGPSPAGAAPHRLPGAGRPAEFSGLIAPTLPTVQTARPPRGGLIECFPERLHPYPFAVSSQIYRGLQRPIALALDGRSGIVQAPDYRGQRALMAYGPIPGLRLGMVVKMDTVELYASIRRQLEIMLPLLALLAAAGLETLRRQVRPMVRQLVESRNQALYDEARFRAAAEGGMDGFFIFECVRAGERGGIVDFRLAYINSQGETLAELPPGQSLGRGLSEFARITPAGGFLEKFRHVAETRQPLVEEFPIQPWSGPPYWLHHQAVPLGDGVAVTVRDITERKRAEQRLIRLAQHDPLTGLPNRRAFLGRLEHAMESSRRLHAQSLLALLYLDLDHLKPINDNLGHLQGDQLLCAFGARLGGCVRAADTVARIGGDEFTVLLENLQGPDDAERVVAAIFGALRAPVDLDGHSVPVSASIGVAFFRGEPIGAEDLVERADAALYTAKREGRNRFSVFGG